MGMLFSRRKKEDKKQDAKRSESSRSMWGGSRSLDEPKGGVQVTPTPGGGAPAPQIECPPGCVTDPNYVASTQGLDPCGKSPPKDEPCPGKDHRVATGPKDTSPPGTTPQGTPATDKPLLPSDANEEDPEVIPGEKEPPYGTGPYSPEQPPVFEPSGKDDKKKNAKPDACEIKDFESAAKIKRKKGVDPCNPESEEDKKKAAKAAKDAKDASAKEAKSKGKDAKDEKGKRPEENVSNKAAPEEPCPPAPCPPGCIPDPAAQGGPPPPPPPPSEPCPPGCIPDPNATQPAAADQKAQPAATDPIPPAKDPKQEAKEKKERERKAKEEEKKRLEEEKKAKEAEKKRLDAEKKRLDAEVKRLEEEKRAQDKEKKRLEDEKKAKEKAEKEKAAKEAKEKAAREAKEAKERAAKELKEKKEAEAAKKKKEEEEKKLRKQASNPNIVKPAGDVNPCPPGCMPDPALSKQAPPPPPPPSTPSCPPGCIPDPANSPPPPPPSEIQCPPGCIRDPNTTVQRINNEVECPPGCTKDHNHTFLNATTEGNLPCPSAMPEPPPPNPCPPMPYQSAQAAPPGWNYPPPPSYQPPTGPNNCPTCGSVQCDQTWPPGKPPLNKDQELASAYCQRHGYYLQKQNFGSRAPPPHSAHYGYGMPEPVSNMDTTPRTQFPSSHISSHDPPTHTKASNKDSSNSKVHVPECPLQRQNTQYQERPNTPYPMPLNTTERPNTPYPTNQYGVVVPVDGSGCCHVPLVTRQVTHYGTRQCQFSANQNEYEGDNDYYGQGAIVPLTDLPTAILPRGAVLYIGGPTEKQHYRYARQRTPSIRVKHISLPKLPYISFQGVPLEDVRPFYSDPVERDGTIRLVIKRKKQQNQHQGNCSMHDTQRNYSVMPGDVRNANFAIKSSEDFEMEGHNRLEYGGPLVHLDDDGRLTIHSEEISNGAVVKRTSVEEAPPAASTNKKLRGKLELVNFNVKEDEKCDSGSGGDKKNSQHEVVDLDNEDEECDDEMEELVYDEDDDMPQECEDEQAEDIMFTIEDNAEDDMDIDEVWIEEDDECPEAEQNDAIACDDEDDDGTACWPTTSTQPPLAQYEQSFKFEPLDEPDNVPVTLENKEPGTFDVMELSSLVSRMTNGVEFDPSDSSIVGDDGDPTVDLPGTSTFTSRTIPPMSDGVSTAKPDKAPRIIRFGSWVKNAILPDYKK